MKHTYLYTYSGPVELWHRVRYSPTDLTGGPALSADASVWAQHVKACDAHGHLYDEFMKFLANAPRACLGRRYTIPGSKNPDAKAFEEGMLPVTGTMTRLLWDGQVVTPDLVATAEDLIVHGQPDDSCEPEAISALLHDSIGSRVLPVWQ